MVMELREKQRLRETFGQHVGEAAAEQILALDPGLGGQERDVTVMFCDIRGFTAYSAGREPAEIVARLNDFLGTMVEIIEKQHGGMINKFLGDGFMALFGAGGSDPSHASRALAAGRDMLGSAATASPGTGKPFVIGIGIHSGPAVVGNIGSPHRLEYTAIGDTVNLASRVEGLTKETGTGLLVTRATRDRLPAGMELKSLGPLAVRGQPAPVEVFTLAGD
jgi:adenylate cyclase